MKNCFLIVNYNDFRSTKHLIDNIKKYKCIDEIVIVDNYSREDEIELLSTMNEKKVNVIYNEANLGYSKAINVGAEYLIDKYQECNIIVSNSDIVILSEEDLVKMIDLLNDPKIGLVGPQVLEKGNILKGRKDCSVNYDIISNMPILRHFVSENHLYYNDTHYNDMISHVDVITTCFFLISSDTLKKISFMDTNVFLYYEDFIIANKVRSLGLDIVICNDVKIKHLYSVSVDKNYKTQKKMKMFRDSQIYYHSTYHKMNFVQKLLLRIVNNINIISKR